MLKNLKYIFTLPKPQDKGYFYSYERIRQLSKKSYYITNCTKGFLGLVARSGYEHYIFENDAALKGESNIPVVIPMQELDNELVKLIKK